MSIDGNERLQWYLPEISDYTALVDTPPNRRSRLKRCQEKIPLPTETAERIFAEQLELQILFFEKMVQEYQGCTLPRLQAGLRQTEA